MTAWPDAVDDSTAVAGLSDDDAELQAAAAAALGNLEALCAAGQLTSDCDQAPGALLRDVRWTVSGGDSGEAVAVGQLVRYEREPTQVLFVFTGSRLQPVPVATVIELSLVAEPAPLGSERWTIMNASAP